MSKDVIIRELKHSLNYLENDKNGLNINNNVLVTNYSRLVSVLYLKKKQLIYTIDSDYLVWIWNLKTGWSEQSHSIRNKEETK